METPHSLTEDASRPSCHGGVVETSGSNPYITPSERTGQSDVENESKNISLASASATITARSNVLIFLITLGDNLPEKPWFVRVNRHASRRSIARSIIFEQKIKILWYCGEITIGSSIVNCPKSMDLLSDHVFGAKK